MPCARLSLVLHFLMIDIVVCRSSFRDVAPKCCCTDDSYCLHIVQVQTVGSGFIQLPPQKRFEGSRIMQPPTVSVSGSAVVDRSASTCLVTTVDIDCLLLQHLDHPEYYHDPNSGHRGGGNYQGNRGYEANGGYSGGQVCSCRTPFTDRIGCWPWRMLPLSKIL